MAYSKIGTCFSIASIQNALDAYKKFPTLMLQRPVTYSSDFHQTATNSIKNLQILIFTMYSGLTTLPLIRQILAVEMDRDFSIAVIRLNIKHLTIVQCFFVRDVTLFTKSIYL